MRTYEAFILGAITSGLVAWLWGKEITDYVLHNGPYVILYQESVNFGLRSNVKGFTWSPVGWTDFWTISK